MTSAFSWQNSISLWPASFCTPRPNFPFNPGVSWLPTFAFQSPVMKRTSFLVGEISITSDMQMTPPLWQKVKSEREVAQSCPTLSYPMDCNLPGSSVHGIFRQEYWSGVPLPSPTTVFEFPSKKQNEEQSTKKQCRSNCLSVQYLYILPFTSCLDDEI